MKRALAVAFGLALGSIPMAMMGTQTQAQQSNNCALPNGPCNASRFTAQDAVIMRPGACIIFDAGEICGPFDAGPGGGGNAPDAGAFTMVGVGTVYPLPNNTIGAATYTTGQGRGVVGLIASASLSAASPWKVTFSGTENSPLQAGFPAVGAAVANGTTPNVNTARASYIYNHQGGLSPGSSSFLVGGARLSSFNSTDGIAQFVTGGNGRVNARLLNDGTDLHYQLSSDGTYWQDDYVEATPSDLTHYGFMIGMDFNGAQFNGGIYITSQIYNVDFASLTAKTITGATNANPIVITTSAAHGYQSGDLVGIHGVGGNTAANTGTGQGWAAGTALIHVLTTTTFELSGVTGNGNYTSGGTVVLVSR